MADLWERLKAAQSRAGSSDPTGFVPTETSGDEPAPPGWFWVSPLVAERRVTFSLDSQFWRILGPNLDPADWYRVFCLDTETTGLSGGAGTVAFLIGWASVVEVGPPGTPPTVEVRQWFLRDHPGEHDLILAVDQALGEAQELVSFNGASFDLPLLKSRWALAGKPFPEIPHRDDLHPARRLWKRLLDSCRLSIIEETILGLHRIDDIPGSQVPVLWYEYLRQGAAADFLTPLEGVLRHHAQDVYSLLCLDLMLSALRKTPGASRWKETFGPVPHRPTLVRPTVSGLLHPDLGPSTPVDFWGLLALKEGMEADQSLENFWEEKDDEAVGMAWADRLKRRGDRRAAEIWARLWKTKHSYQALEELLKWLEHRDRTEGSRAEALVHIDEALKLTFVPQLWRLELERRRDRLVRKNQRQNSPS